MQEVNQSLFFNPSSKFATKNEIQSIDFQKINKELVQINEEHQLPDFSDINRNRFSWSEDIPSYNSIYCSRLWEYPFAILSSDLQPGMKCADIGCGNTPFTPYLCSKVGAENVYGIDEDIREDEDKQKYAFGSQRELVNKFGFHFLNNNIAKIDLPDNFFDRVFCISVYEHIQDQEMRLAGISEMVRILKPGGRLVITFDMGIDIPLNYHLDFIRFSGLQPFNDCISLRWPEERFLQIDGMAIDVYGLVLEKPDIAICRNVGGAKELALASAYERYIKLAKMTALPYNTLLMAADLKGKSGVLKFLTKYILGRY